MPNETEVATAPLSLAEAMKKGIAVRKLAARGVYFAGEDKADALGAAYIGFTGQTDVHNYMVGTELDDAYPILTTKVHTPEGDGKVRTLKQAIRYLNDELKWKRKNIARFVASVEARNS